MSTEAPVLPVRAAFPEALALPGQRPQTQAPSATRSEPIIDRLVVLVPDHAGDPAELAAQIRAMAAPRRLPVLLIGQIVEEPETWAVRRDLSTLAALVAQPEIRVDSVATTTPSWIEILRRIVLPGDMVVCHLELTVGRSWPWKRQSLAEVIRTELNVPVCALKGFVPGLRQARARWLSGILGSLLPFIFIGVVSAIQIAIQILTTGWWSTVLLSVTAVVEILALAYLTLRSSL